MSCDVSEQYIYTSRDVSEQYMYTNTYIYNAHDHVYCIWVLRSSWTAAWMQRELKK